MAFWLIGSALLLLAFTWFWRTALRHPRVIFESAKEAEKQRAFEEATWLYGEALSSYYKPAEPCRSKIRELWVAHGPFEFSRKREAILRRSDMDRDGDPWLFDETVSIIKQVVAGQKEKHSWEN